MAQDPLRDAQMLRGAEALPNPRPVSVDEQGRIFEATGRPFAMPGLEPEAIRAGLADLAAGRVRSLEETASNRVAASRV